MLTIVLITHILIFIIGQVGSSILQECVFLSMTTTIYRIQISPNAGGPPWRQCELGVTTESTVQANAAFTFVEHSCIAIASSIVLLDFFFTYLMYFMTL